MLTFRIHNGNRGKTPGDYAGWQRMRIRSAKLGTIG